LPSGITRLHAEFLSFVLMALLAVPKALQQANGLFGSNGQRVFAHWIWVGNQIDEVNRFLLSKVGKRLNKTTNTTLSESPITQPGSEVLVWSAVCVVQTFLKERTDRARHAKPISFATDDLAIQPNPVLRQNLSEAMALKDFSVLQVNSRWGHLTCNNFPGVSKVKPIMRSTLTERQYERNRISAATGPPRSLEIVGRARGYIAKHHGLK
jgi:hypothetical protein